MITLSLRNKLLFYSVALATIPLGIAGRKMIRITQDELKSSANNEISTTVDRLTSDIDDFYEFTWRAPLLLVASGIENEQLGPEEKLSLVKAAIQNIGDIVACQISLEGVEKPILILKDDFAERLSEKGLDPSLILEKNITFVEEQFARPSQDVFVGDLSFVEASSDWLITIAIPLKTLFADRRAIFLARVSMTRLQNYIENHAFARTGSITLVQKDGRKIFDPERTDLKQWEIVREALAMMSSPSRAIGVRPFARPSGEIMLAGFSFSRYFNWSIIVERNEKDAYLAISQMVNALSWWIAAGLAIAILGAIFFAFRISKPVEEIANVAHEVGQGNLEVRVKPTKSRDEIARLGHRMNGMIQGLSERDFIRETFGRYVSPEVAQKVLSDPSALHPGGEMRTVTVFMSDLRGFTSLSEHLSPAEMVELLNAYLGRMSDPISAHGGTVIEFIGDAIMALFGAPFVHDDDPLRAVACAAQMQIDLMKFNQEIEGISPLQMGIGIKTGSVIVGNIGSEKRMKYGVVGDDVNLAARIESFTVGGEILVSESTRIAVGDRATFRGPIEVKAKGKKEPLVMYALVSVGAPYNLEVPHEHQKRLVLTQASLEGRCYKIDGKKISENPIVFKIKLLSMTELNIELKEELNRFDNVKLEIFFPKTDTAQIFDDAYAKIIRSEKKGETYHCRLRFTSIPEDQQNLLQEYLDNQNDS